MNRTTIVCGVDGSPDSNAAVRVARELAARLGTRLVLAHVGEPNLAAYSHVGPFGGMKMAGPPAAAEEREGLRRHGAELLAQVSRELDVEGADRRVEIGLPAERLADIADEEDAELIVVGSRGRGAFKAAFLGSVSNSLVGMARQPVLVVPPGAMESS